MRDRERESAAGGRDEGSRRGDRAADSANPIRSCVPGTTNGIFYSPQMIMISTSDYITVQRA